MFMIKQSDLETTPPTRMVGVTHDSGEERMNVECVVLGLELDGRGGRMKIETDETEWVTTQLEVQMDPTVDIVSRSYKLDLQFDEIFGVKDVRAVGCHITKADWGDLVCTWGGEGPPPLVACEFVIDRFPDTNKFVQFEETQ